MKQSNKMISSKMISNTMISRTRQTLLAGFLATALSAPTMVLADDYTINGTGGGDPNNYATLQELQTANPLLDGDLITLVPGAAATQYLSSAFRATSDEDFVEDESLMFKSDLSENSGTISKANGANTRFITNEDTDFLRLAGYRDDNTGGAVPSTFTISNFNGSDAMGGAFYGGTLILGSRGNELQDVEYATLKWENNSVKWDTDGSAFGGALYVKETLDIWGDINIFTGNTVSGDTIMSGGGAIFVGGEYMNLTGTLEFTNNSVVLEGARDGQLAVGGAIFVESGNASIVSRDALFEGNSVKGDFEANGGALAVKGNLTIYGDVMVSGLQDDEPMIKFINNTAEAANPGTGSDNYSYGGAILVLSGTTTIGNVSNPTGTILFEGNKALGINTSEVDGKAAGGAIASKAYSGRSLIQKTIFKENEAKGIWGASGGALYFDGILTLQDNTFEGNIAESTYLEDSLEHHANAEGGAISGRNSITLTGTNVFSGNQVITPQFGQGGAITVMVAQGRDYTTEIPMLNIGGAATFANNGVFVSEARSTASGGAISTAFSTIVSGATFDSNRVVSTGTATGSMGSIEVYGGAIAAGSGLTLEGWNLFTGNFVEATNGKAYGGALYIDRTAIYMAGSQEFLIGGNSSTGVTSFSGNRAVTTADGGIARGGAIAVVDGKAATFIDTQFIGNSAEATQAGNALGGAVYMTGNLSIVAENQNVLFDLNTIKADGTETPNDIHLANAGLYGDDPDPILSLNAVEGRAIVFGGGITGTGSIVVNDHNPVLGSNYFGAIDFAKSGITDLEGNLSIMAGTLKTAIVVDTAIGNGAYKSNVILRQWENDEGDNEGGLVEIAPDVSWTVDTSDVRNGVQGQVFLGEGGWVSNAAPGADAQALVQEALDRGNNMYFGLLTAGTGPNGEAVLGVDTSKVHVSDLYVNTLLMHAANTMRNSANGRIDHNFARFIKSSNDCGSSQSKKTCCIGSSLWGNFVGRSTKLDSKTYSSGAGARWEKAKISSSGLQVGADIFATRRAQFGLMVGGENAWNRLGSLDEVKANDYYFGMYGAYMLNNGFDIRGLFGGGYQKYDMKRLQTLGTAEDRGVFNSRFSGKTFEGTLEIGRRFCLDQKRLSFRPVLGFDVFNNDIDGTTEYGGLGVEGLRYSNMSLTQMFIRVGSDLQWTRNRLNLNGGLYYSYDMSSDGDTLETWASRGGSGNVVLGSDLGSSVFSFNVGANYYMNHAETVSLFGNYYGDYFTDRDGKPLGHTAIAGIQIRF